MALRYTTTKQLGDILRIVKTIPSRDIGATPVKETVGTGDNSATIYYLDHTGIVASSYTLYYGATEATATSTLTETTHFTIDLTTAKITLTSAGVTALGTDGLFAEYQYFDLDFQDSYLQTVLERAEQIVDDSTNTTFIDGTATNPSYTTKVDILASGGQWQQEYYSTKRPLIDIASTLSANITSSDTSIALATGDGALFPSSGSAVIGTEAITYTGISTDTLTGVTRGTLDSTAAAHVSGDSIHSSIVQISETTDGSTPTFDVLSWDSQVYVKDNGKVYIHENTKIDNIPADIENRFKLTYLYGFNSIPTDIVRLTLLFAKRELIQDNVSKALIAGRNEFKPEMFNIDNQEIERIITKYRQLDMTVT